MSPTEAQTMSPVNASGSFPPDPQAEDHYRYHLVLLYIYSVVLLTGTISLSLMVRIIVSTTRSVTSIAVLNLILAHFLFLFTVPFRIHYYATSRWRLGLEWCRVVSSMVHIHMVLSFIFYVIILVTRLITFHCKTVQMFLRRLHALLASVLVWAVVLLVVPCSIYFLYGTQTQEGVHHGNGTCFQFGSNIDHPTTVLNYFMSSGIICVTVVMTALQAHVLLLLHRKYGGECTSQQDFWAQLKSFCFALIMVMCFIPYHGFRLYYVTHLHLEDLNEVLLALTTLNCLDMLTFLGRGTCYRLH